MLYVPAGTYLPASSSSRNITSHSICSDWTDDLFGEKEAEAESEGWQCPYTTTSMKSLPNLIKNFLFLLFCDLCLACVYFGGWFLSEKVKLALARLRIGPHGYPICFRVPKYGGWRESAEPSFQANNYHSTFFSVLYHFHTIYRQKFINFFFNKKSSPLFFILSFFFIRWFIPSNNFFFSRFLYSFFIILVFFYLFLFFPFTTKCTLFFAQDKIKKIYTYKLYEKEKGMVIFFRIFFFFFTLLHSRFWIIFLLFFVLTSVIFGLVVNFNFIHLQFFCFYFL